jgi:hypothetical protein
MKLVETASKWGNLYRLRYYLNGRRISDAEMRRLIAANPDRKQVKSERVVKLAGWRTTWEID